MNGWLETTSFRRHYNYNNYNIHGLRYFVVPQKFIPRQHHSLTNQLRISMNCWKPPVLDVITIIYMYFSSPPTAAATQTTQIRSVQLKSDTNVLVKCLKSCTFWNVVLFKCLKCCTFWNPTQFWPNFEVQALFVAALFILSLFVAIPTHRYLKTFVQLVHGADICHSSQIQQSCLLFWISSTRTLQPATILQHVHVFADKLVQVIRPRWVDIA